jgi:hypothetical protein
MIGVVFKPLHHHFCTRGITTVLFKLCCEGGAIVRLINLTFATSVVVDGQYTLLCCF